MDEVTVAVGSLFAFEPRLALRPWRGFGLRFGSLLAHDVLAGAADGQVSRFRLQER
jgi:hypothetical protein